MPKRILEKVLLISLLVISSGLIGTGFWWATDWYGVESLRFLLITLLRGEEELRAAQEAATFDDVMDVPYGLFNYGGSAAWAPIRENVDPIIQKSRPQFQLRYTDPITGEHGSGTGIQMLLGDQLAFAQSSRSLSEEEHQQAKQLGFSLKQIPVAIDGIAVAVHPDLRIPGLTVAQIKDIYTGNIINWEQVGGPDLPITPYSRSREVGGTVEFFAEYVLEGDEFGTNVEIVSDTTSGIQQVSAKRGGIYYASATLIVNQCLVKPLPIGRNSNNLVPPYQEPLIDPSQCPNQRNFLNRTAIQSGEYPITRRLFVIVKRNDQDDEQAGIAYATLLLSDQGQKLIRNAGFINLR